MRALSIYIDISKSIFLGFALHKYFEFAAFVFILSTFSSNATAGDWPKPNFDDCNFYIEAEKTVQCKNRGSDYLTNYGFFYCNEFKKASKAWSKKAQDWTKDTGLCLQEMLFDNRIKRISPCPQLEEFAFDAHPVCYKQYKICDLTFEDIVSILDVVRGVDYLTRKSATQAINVGLACIQQYISAEESAAQNRFVASTKSFSQGQRVVAKEFFSLAPKRRADRSAYFREALSLMLYGGKVPESRIALDAYVSAYGQSKDQSDDSRFFDCTKALGMGTGSAMCDPEFTAKMQTAKTSDLKIISKEISPERMQSIIKALRRFSSLR